jgi:energy-coupling factor transport system ATP-binding protein
LNGLIRPRERGKVLVDGCDLADLSIDIKALRRKVGLIFQNPERQLFKRLVKEDISFGPRRMGLSEEEINERVKWAMDMVGLNFDDFKDRFTFSLSGGEMRRVAIAGILALRPKVLILDESTSGLDPKGRKDFLSRIKSFKREGMTIIFISPNMEDVAEIVDKVYVMEEGRMVMSGTPEDVFSKPEELRRYGLGVPQVAEVMHELMERGIEVSAIPLTIAEAEEEILRILKPASFD